MKKLLKHAFLILIALILVACAPTQNEAENLGAESGRFDNGAEKLEDDFWQRFYEKAHEASQIYQQNEFVTLLKKCDDDKAECKNAVDFINNVCYHGQSNTQKAFACGTISQVHLIGDEKLMTKIDKDKAEEYANKTCSLDGSICVNMAKWFDKANETILALQYFENACEMGEPYGCGLAFDAYSGEWEGKSIKKDTKKAKYYKAKVCEAGYKDFCG